MDFLREISMKSVLLVLPLILIIFGCRDGHFEKRNFEKISHRLVLKPQSAEVLGCEKPENQPELECFELKIDFLAEDIWNSEIIQNQNFQIESVFSQNEASNFQEKVSTRQGIIHFTQTLYTLEAEAYEEFILRFKFTSEDFGDYEASALVKLADEEKPLKKWAEELAEASNLFSKLPTNRLHNAEAFEIIKIRELSSQASSEENLYDFQFKITDDSTNTPIRNAQLNLILRTWTQESFEIQAESDSEGFVHFQQALTYQTYQNEYQEKLDVEIDVNSQRYPYHLTKSLLVQLSLVEPLKKVYSADDFFEVYGNEVRWSASETPPRLSLDSIHIPKSNETQELSFKLGLLRFRFGGQETTPLPGIEISTSFQAVVFDESEQMVTYRTKNYVVENRSLDNASSIQYSFDLDRSWTRAHPDYLLLVSVSTDELKSIFPAYFFIRPDGQQVRKLDQKPDFSRDEKYWR